MSVIDISGLRADATSARYAARKTLQQLTKASAADRQAAQVTFDAASQASEEADLRAARAAEVLSGGHVVRDGASVRVGKEPATYRKDGPHSWFHDCWRATVGDHRALERIERHGRELLRAGRINESTARALNEEATKGGALAPPAYMQKELVKLARASRPYLAKVTIKRLPDHVQEVNFPRITGGAATAPQADLGEVVSVDIATDEVKLPITAIPGTVDTARQLYERAVPLLLDGVLLPDLAEDYFGKTDVQALTGSGTGANLTGVASNSEVNKPVWNEATPTLAGFYKAIAYCKWITWTKRLLAPNLLVVNPVLWAWIEEQKDKQDHPIIPPRDLTPAQAVYLDGEEGTVGEPVGELLGLRVVLDPNIPVNLGAGKNQTACVVQRAEDTFWFEMPDMQTRVYDDTADSGDLVVRVQVWNYAACAQGRYPKGINWLTGTGLIAPEPTV